MAYLYLNVGVGENRDIGGRHEVKDQFSLVGRKAVFSPLPHRCIYGPLSDTAGYGTEVMTYL